MPHQHALRVTQGCCCCHHHHHQQQQWQRLQRVRHPAAGALGSRLGGLPTGRPHPPLAKTRARCQRRVTAASGRRPAALMAAAAAPPVAPTLPLQTAAAAAADGFAAASACCCHAAAPQQDCLCVSAVGRKNAQDLRRHRCLCLLPPSCRPASPQCVGPGQQDWHWHRCCRQAATAARSQTKHAAAAALVVVAACVCH
jgi:hypothetical protein